MKLLRNKLKNMKKYMNINLNKNKIIVNNNIIFNKTKIKSKLVFLF